MASGFSASRNSSTTADGSPVNASLKASFLVSTTICIDESREFFTIPACCAASIKIIKASVRDAHFSLPSRNMVSLPGITTRAELNTQCAHGVAGATSSFPARLGIGTRCPSVTVAGYLPLKGEVTCRPPKVVRKFRSQSTKNAANIGSPIEYRIHLHRFSDMLTMNKSDCSAVKHRWNHPYLKPYL